MGFNTVVEDLSVSVIQLIGFLDNLIRLVGQESARLKSQWAVSAHNTA